MPQRTMNLWMIVLGIIGLAVVALLALTGRDPKKVARHGARWVGGLIAAALLLLGSIGVYGDLRGGNGSGPLNPVLAWLRDKLWHQPIQTTCYEPQPPPPPAPNTVEHLAYRAGLLEQFANESKLQKDVMLKTLREVEDELVILESASTTQPADDASIRAAVFAEARVNIAKARARLALPANGDSTSQPANGPDRMK